MSRLRNMSRVGWIVTGVVVALVLVPSAAFATARALKFTGIEGTSTHKADVTAAQQLLTTEASPASDQVLR